MLVYPSGFLGADRPMTTPPSQFDVAKSIIEKQQIPPAKLVPYSIEISKLWKMWSGRDPQCKSLEFVLKVVEQALCHFGEEDLVKWIQGQWRSPEYGVNHETWLSETVCFVLMGYRRHTNYDAWSFILTVGGNTGGARLMGDKMRQAMGNEVIYGARVVSMREFVLQWLQRPGGLEDLVESLHVLYGNR